MARLPFGRNPFAEPAPSVTANQSRPSASVLATTSRPPHPPVNTGDKQDKGRKRDTTEAPKHPQGKKHKSSVPEESPSDSIVSTFGSVAAENFSEDDVKILKSRSEEEAEFNFRVGLGDAFYHGLKVLAQKNSTIKEQDRALKKYKSESTSLNLKLSEAQKKLENEAKARKDDVERLQSAFDKLKLDSEKAISDLEGENLKLRGESDELAAGVRKGQSEAYCAGFTDYLRNFIAADPDYDWSNHFAPSTPAYMLKFKAENVETIAAAKEELRRKIEAELKAKDEQEAQEKGTADVENSGAVSPTQTAAT